MTLFATNPTATADDIADLERESDLIKAQRELQAAEMAGQCFFPYDGRCYQCRCKLVDVINEEILRSECVTDCPSCHRSFV